ncbi:MAG TPA: hypothetical protein VIB79_04195 [Candidatus Binatia bacterium]
MYQRSAVVRTVVPVTYKKLCKMYMRWDRSYVREELRFARLVRKRPLRIAAIAVFDRVVTNLRYAVGYASIALLCFHGIEHPLMFVRMMTAVGFMSLLNMFYYLYHEHSADSFTAFCTPTSRFLPRPGFFPTRIHGTRSVMADSMNEQVFSDRSRAYRYAPC